MHRLTQRLHNEHKHIAKLMICLRHQVAKLADEEQQADIQLILDILDYVANYPEQWHHPFEDLIFSAVINKGGETTDLELLLSQHQELNELTRKVTQYFNQIMMGGIVPVEDVVAAAREYIDTQLKHLSFEENTAFKWAESALSEDDWLALEAQATDVGDPIFGPSVEQRYQHIYQSIIQQEYPY